VGPFALPLLVLLAATEPLPSADQQVVVPPPARPIFIKPVPLESVAVIGEEPRYVAPTRLDKIGRIWAPVTVNGQGPYRLVLATGASSTALTPQLAEALGVRVDAADTVMLRGSTGSVAVPVVPVATLEIGDFLMEPGRLAVIPDALGGADGVLGMDALANKRINIDFRHDRVTIMRSKNQRAGSGFVTIPVSMLHGLLVVDAVMGGVPVKAIIDTGGQVTLGNMALRLALAERRGNGVQEGKMDQVFGSTLDMQVGTRLETPSLALGTLLVRSPAMIFADFEIFKYWKMTDEPAMLIGMDVIGLLDALVIDYRRQELQVRLSSK
jgi:hypothetical protein